MLRILLFFIILFAKKNLDNKNSQLPLSRQGKLDIFFFFFHDSFKNIYFSLLRKEKYIFLPWKYIFPCLGQGKIYFPGPRPGKIYFPGPRPGKYILASYFWFFYFSKKNSIIFFQNDKYILRNKYKNASHFYFISQNIFIILKKDARILFGKMKNSFVLGIFFRNFPRKFEK